MKRLAIIICVLLAFTMSITANAAFDLNEVEESIQLVKESAEKAAAGFFENEVAPETDILDGENAPAPDMDAEEGEDEASKNLAYIETLSEEATAARDKLTAQLDALKNQEFKGKDLNLMTSNPEIGMLDYTIEFGNGRAYLVDEDVEDEDERVYIPLFTDGDGSAYNPFIISTADDLFQLQYLVNELGYTMGEAYFVQTEDIDLKTSASKPWIPIGYIYGGEIQSMFSGYYDGNNHTISGVYVKGGTGTSSGFFGFTGNAMIIGLNISDSTVSGDICGSLVGTAFDSYIYGCNVLQNVKVTSTVDDACIGGLVGIHSAVSEDSTGLSYCSSAATLSPTGYGVWAGGIVGLVDGYSYDEVLPVIGCRFTGKITGAYCGGGIAGEARRANFMVCYNSAPISAENYASGIVAELYFGEIYGCYNAGAISNAKYSTGIVTSMFYCDVLSCYNVGSLKGTNKANTAYFGDDYSSIWYCYATTKDVSAIQISTTDLKKQSKLSGFDFDYVWCFEKNQNSGYPVLQMFYPKLLSNTGVYDKDNPDAVYLQFSNKGNIVTCIDGISGGWYSEDTPETGRTKITIYPEYFELYTPSGTYTYTVNFGAGCSVPFTVNVDNCIHEYGYTEKLNATCTENGYYKVYCTACNELLYTDIYEATGHSFSEEYSVDMAPTCETAGSKSQHCANCDATQNSTPVEPLGHSYAECEAQAPTCAVAGWEAYTYCLNCDYSTKVEIPTLPHTIVYHEGKEVTYLEPGWAPYETCELCPYTTFEEILPVHPESVTIQAASAIKAGQQVQFTAVVMPEDTTCKNVVWASSNENVLVIDENGLATAVGSGKATISATTVDGGVKGQLQVTVERAITNIELSGSSAVAVGKSITLKANTFCYEYGVPKAVSGSVIWESSDDNIATVSSSGKVTGKAAGNVTITATVSGTELTDSIDISVAAPITSLKISSTKATAYVGKTLDMAPMLTAVPEGHTDTIVWSVDKPDIGEVDENGVLTAKKAGTVKVTATAVAGNKKVTCTVTVSREPEWIVITGNNAVAAGKSITLKGDAYYNENGTDVKTKDTISWSVDDENIATITDKGKLTGKANGTVTVTAYVANTDVTETMEVDVVVPVKSLKLSSTKAAAYIGKTLDVGAMLTTTPEDHTDNIIWTVDKPDIGEVDENGVLTAKKAGTVKVTAKAVAGGKSATCTVTVSKEPEWIIITGNNAVAIGKSITLKGAAYYDNNETDVKTKDTISWRVDDENIATITSAGKLTGKANGTVTVTAYVANTDISKTMEINVVIPAKTVKLNSTKAAAYIGKTLDIGAMLTTTPEDHTDNIIWTVDKPDIGKVDENGILTAKKAGTVKVTATAVAANKKVTCTVTVSREPEWIIITGNNSVAIGKNITLKGAAYYDDNGTAVKTKDTISWRVDNITIADISDKGKLTGKMMGTVTVTAYVANTDISETIEIAVVIPATKLTFTPNKLNAAVGDIIDLSGSLTIAPITCTDDITWKSSKTTVAVVDEEGVVTIVGKGTATITAKAVTGGKSATCTITVK